MALPSPQPTVPPAPPAPVSGDAVSQGDDDVLDLRELSDLLLRGKKILLATALAFVVPVAAYSWLQPSLYRSTTTILIRKEAGSLTGVLPGAGQFYQVQENLENEILVLKESLELAETVAGRLLQLRRAPGSDVPLTVLSPLEDGSAPSVSDVAFRLQYGGYIDADAASDRATAVVVGATSTDPAEAALVANEYSRAFVELSLKNSQAGISQSRSFLEERLGDQGEELQRLDAEVQSYLEREEAVALPEETSRTASQIGELDGAIGAVDVEIGAARARLSALRSELRRLEPLLSERLGSGLDAELAAAQGRVQELEANLESIYQRTPSLRSAPSSSDPELARLRGELDRARARARSVSAQLSRQAIASGSGPGNQSAGFTRAGELRSQVSDAEIQLSQLEARRTQLSRQLAEAESQLSDIPAQTIGLAQLQRERQAAETLYGALRSNYQEAQLAEESGIGTGRIIRPALVYTEPIAPARVRNVLLALVMGLGLGGAIAVAKVRLDHRLHAPDDVTDLGYPLIATVPDMTALVKRDFGGAETVAVGTREIDSSVVTLLNPMTTASEAYRGLRTSVQFSRPDVVVQTVLVTSANPSEGKSTTTANLAVVMAQAGRRVLLVDADLRKPTAHRKLGVAREPGLVQVLFEDADFDPSTIPMVADDLFVLTSGATVPNPSELLGSKRMREVIERMRESFDVVLFDAPPVLAATDAVLLSTQCDATLVVCKAGSTKDFELAETHHALQSVGASVIGTVLNGFDASLSHGYKYSQRYGNDYAYGSETH